MFAKAVSLIALLGAIAHASPVVERNFIDGDGNLPPIDPRLLLELGEGEGPAHKNALPFEEKYFTEAAGAMQNTYCGAEFNKPGLTYDDQTILYAYGDGADTQRINVIHSNVGIIVANMGTNLTDLISSLRDITPGSLPGPEATGLPDGALIATGWVWAFDTIWDQAKVGIADAIKSYPDLPVIVTGHSQGAFGALTALAIEKAHPGKVQKVILFGPARVGNKAYADHVSKVFGNKYAGVLNGEDWVPSAPLEAMGYVQPNNMIHISPANSTTWTWYENGEDKRWVSTHKKLLVDYGFRSNPWYYFYWGDHQGTYFHTQLRTEASAGGNCPAKVGGA